MISLQVAKQSFTWIAVTLGFASALLWHRASVAKITDETNVYNPDVEIATRDHSDPGKYIQIVATAMEQSRLNKIASILTALAVLCQAIATGIPEY
ncbi:hypothetical protein [[Pseudomonas] boreopolis]|uniref:hypothetical protein n=1 Tax=Xanthomonas boreopolis TaxID=86183 RepID=UPI003D9B4308